MRLVVVKELGPTTVAKCLSNLIGALVRRAARTFIKPKDTKTGRMWLLAIYS